MDECKCRMGSIDLDVTYSNATAVLVWLCALGGASFGGSASLVRIVQSDCNRIHQVLKLMNVHEDWQMDKFFDDMKVRTKYGIPQDLVDLCKIPGLGKNYAIQLYNKGIESLSDMQERLDEVEDLGGLKLKNMIRKDLSEISRESC